jgi:hypothetical protein
MVYYTNKLYYKYKYTFDFPLCSVQFIALSLDVKNYSYSTATLPGLEMKIHGYDVPVFV